MKVSRQARERSIAYYKVWSCICPRLDWMQHRYNVGVGRDWEKKPYDTEGKQSFYFPIREDLWWWEGDLLASLLLKYSSLTPLVSLALSRNHHVPLQLYMCHIRRLVNVKPLIRLVALSHLYESSSYVMGLALLRRSLRAYSPLQSSLVLLNQPTNICQDLCSIGLLPTEVEAHIFHTYIKVACVTPLPCPPALSPACKSSTPSHECGLGTHRCNSLLSVCSGALRYKVDLHSCVHPSWLVLLWTQHFVMVAYNHWRWI